MYHISALQIHYDISIHIFVNLHRTSASFTYILYHILYCISALQTHHNFSIHISIYLNHIYIISPPFCQHHTKYLIYHKISIDSTSQQSWTSIQSISTQYIQVQTYLNKPLKYQTSKICSNKIYRQYTFSLKWERCVDKKWGIHIGFERIITFQNMEFVLESYQIIPKTFLEGCHVIILRFDLLLHFFLICSNLLHQLYYQTPLESSNPFPCSLDLPWAWAYPSIFSCSSFLDTLIFVNRSNKVKLETWDSW